MRQAFVRSPRWSASRNAIALRMSDCTVRRILREDLNFHPHKKVMVQAINDQDTVNRKAMSFCWTLWITTTLNTSSWRMKLIFIFCGNVNSPNCRYWANENPRDIHQKSLHSESYCLVWCSIFWVDRPLFLWRRGRQGSNSKFSPLHWDASHISGTVVAETWCWKPDSLVSPTWGNSSHCEDCNAGPQRDVPS